MVNANKAKGDRFERDVLEKVLPHFPDARRTRAGRRTDQGDIHLDRAPIGILQTKDVATPQWRDWLKELEEQKRNAGAEYGALVVKRRGSGGRPSLSLAVLDLDDYLSLIQEAVDHATCQ